jgi:hypothetical protein
MSSDSDIPIQDKIVVPPQIVYTQLRVIVSNVVLNEKAFITAILFTEDYITSQSFNLELIQPEYGEWGANDDFIINWVIQQLGLTPK